MNVFTVRPCSRVRVRLHVPFFVPFKNGLNPMVPFTHDVKKIKGVAHKKNGDIDATCKQTLTSAFEFVPNVKNGFFGNK